MVETELRPLWPMWPPIRGRGPESAMPLRRCESGICQETIWKQWSHNIYHQLYIYSSDMLWIRAEIKVTSVRVRLWSKQRGGDIWPDYAILMSPTPRAGKFGCAHTCKALAKLQRGVAWPSIEWFIFGWDAYCRVLFVTRQILLCVLLGKQIVSKDTERKLSEYLFSFYSATAQDRIKCQFYKATESKCPSFYRLALWLVESSFFWN